MQAKIDDFFLTPEEKFVEKLKRYGGRVKIPMRDNAPDPVAVAKLFSMSYDEFMRMIRELRRKKLVYYNSNFYKKYFLVSLTPRFIEFLSKAESIR